MSGQSFSFFADHSLAGGVESGESSTEDRLRPAPVEADQRFDHYELVTGEDGKPVELGRGITTAAPCVSPPV